MRKTRADKIGRILDRFISKYEGKDDRQWDAKAPCHWHGTTEMLFKTRHLPTWNTYELNTVVLFAPPAKKARYTKIVRLLNKFESRYSESDSRWFRVAEARKCLYSWCLGLHETYNLDAALNKLGYLIKNRHRKEGK